MLSPSKIGNYISPKDDILNWLFLKVENHLYGFIYRIPSPLEAVYHIPFKVEMSFFMPEQLQTLADDPNWEYEIYRGQELIGTAKICRKIQV